MIETTGWLDTEEHFGLIADATDKFGASMLADSALNDFVAEAHWDAGFEAGVEAQKNGLGEA